MLDFLERHLNRGGLTILNLTSAGFETGETAVGEELRPSVKSVRFEGAHLLSSKPACELLVEGRGLVDMSLLIRFETGRDQSVILPIRISLERDYVAVLTGFGAHRPQVASDVQRVIVDRLMSALGAPLKDEPVLNQLAVRIHLRAREDEPVDRADILAPDRPWGADEGEA